MKLLRAIAAGCMYRVKEYLDLTGRAELFEAAPELLAAIAELELSDLDLLEKEEADPKSPYGRLIGIMGWTPEGQTLLDLACAVMLYPAFGAILKEWRGHLVTPELACFMEEDDPDYGTLLALSEGAKRVLQTDSRAEPFYQGEFFADNRILGYLCGDDAMDGRLSGVAELFCGDREQKELPPLIIHEALCGQLQQMLATRQEDILLCGSPGSGRKHLLRHALRERGERMIFADVTALSGCDGQGETLLALLAREALLCDCGICLYGITQELLGAQPSVKPYLYRLLAPLRRESLRLVFCCDEGVELLPYLERGVCVLQVPDATRQERIRLWEQYLMSRSLPLDAVMLGSKYHLTPAEISRAVLQLPAADADGGQADERTVREVLRRILPPVPHKGDIEQPHPNCTLGELVLPPQTLATIRHVCDHVWQSHKVYDEWNMESRFAYGRAVSVLLCGPPGTGKTMTARVISDMLGLPLYHVNLSQVADKYIGETEKHLEEIFRNAQKSNLILFFDEADAIFSRRSLVSDAKDKYANTEVSYILQRLETYDGVVILATNFLNNIDPAFMRRMQYVITFYMPGVEERRTLWQKSIPAECPSEAIDFDFLAEQFEFSGSNIKSAVLAAVFYAAGEGEALGMKHLIYGVRNELVKKGQPVFSTTFGKYAYYAMPEDEEEQDEE